MKYSYMIQRDIVIEFRMGKSSKCIRKSLKLKEITISEKHLNRISGARGLHSQLYGISILWPQVTI